MTIDLDIEREMNDLPRGTLVGDRFEILERIGEGGMGTVYTATQRDLGRRVAVKVILPELARRPGARKRFTREARVASALRHPNAVEVYDFGELGDTLYLAMELLSGVTLRQVVDEDKPPLRPEQAVSYASQIADVLVAAQSIGLVHRDLKPENIILDRRADGSERVVVVDFGLAFVQEGQEDIARLTREGVVTGTPDYMSPEQARGVEVTPSSDVYSLGCLLYEMLCSRVPFFGNPTVLLSRHIFVAPTPLRELRPDLGISGALDDLVIAMLAKSPSDRPDARAVRDALRRVDLSRPERLGGLASDGQAVGRAARMLSEAPRDPASGTTSQPAGSSPVPALAASVAILGAVDEALRLELATNGLEAYAASGADTDADAFFAPEATLETVAELARHGRPVISDAAAGDIVRLTGLLRAGAADVVSRPIKGADLARKLLRALRRTAPLAP